MAGATRELSLGEEIANSITHGVGLAAAIAALPVLVVVAARRGDPWGIVGGAVFGATLVLLYGASTLYHALPATRLPRAKHVFRVLDHAAIYLLIAGTYTPFALGPLRGPWGWSLLGVVWGLAICGVVLKATAAGFRFPRLSTSVYLGMGWLAVIALRPLAASLTPGALAWLVAGGICYTAGVLFFSQRRRYSHAIWHLFVAAGSICHFVAVLHAGAPRVA